MTIAINRRQFIGYSSAAAATTLIGASAIFEIACNSATVLKDVEAFEPVVLNSLNLACAISTGLPICGMQDTIKQDYDLVVNLWQQWLTAVANGTSTLALWNELNGAFTVFEQNAMQIFQAAGGLNVPEITAVVAAAQVLLAAIEALFPAAPKSGLVEAKPMPTVFIGARPSNFSLSDWVKSYNASLAAAKRKYPSANVTPIQYKPLLRGVKMYGIRS